MPTKRAKEDAMGKPGGTTRKTTMSGRRSLAFVPVAVGVLLGGLGVFSVSAAPPVGTDASEVTHWNQVAATTLIAFPPPDGGSPVAFQLNMGMVQGAVYDAVNAIGPKTHRSYLLQQRAGARASIDAAVATAAYDVLSNLVTTAPERAPFPGRAGLQTSLNTQYAASLLSAPAACGCEGFDRRCRRNGGVRRPLEPRHDRTRESAVPRSCGTPGHARHAAHSFARCDRR